MDEFNIRRKLRTELELRMPSHKFNEIIEEINMDPNLKKSGLIDKIFDNYDFYEIFNLIYNKYMEKKSSNKKAHNLKMKLISLGMDFGEVSEDNVTENDSKKDINKQLKELRLNEGRMDKVEEYNNNLKEIKKRRKIQKERVLNEIRKENELKAKIKLERETELRQRREREKIKIKEELLKKDQEGIKNDLTNISNKKEKEKHSNLVIDSFKGLLKEGEDNKVFVTRKGICYLTLYIPDDIRLYSDKPLSDEFNKYIEYSERILDYKNDKCNLTND